MIYWTFHNVLYFIILTLLGSTSLTSVLGALVTLLPVMYVVKLHYPFDYCEYDDTLNGMPWNSVICAIADFHIYCALLPEKNLQ